MSVKQDRQGARTAADVERKYNFGKKFAEVYGMITDARDSVDSLGSELRDEIVKESTAIRRDTQQIVLEATKDVVRAEEFGEYKKSAEASLTVTAEGIRQEVSAVETQVTNLGSDLTETKNALIETKNDLAETDKNLAEYWEYTQEVESGVDTKLETKEGEILASVSSNYYNKTQIDKTVGDINTGIAAVDSKVDTNYTKVTDEYKAHTASELEILEESITAKVEGAEKRLTDVETKATGTETALNNYTSATDQFKQQVNEDLEGLGEDLDGVIQIQGQYLTDENSEFKILNDRITSEVSSYEEAITSVTDRIGDAEDDISANYEAYEKYVEQTDSSIDQLSDKISLNFDRHEEQYSNVNGKVTTMETNLEKHFEFGVNGLTIRAGEGEMKLRIDNDIISFYKGNIDENDLEKNRFGWWDGVNFHTGNIVIAVQERAQFGDFAFVPRSDGSLDFLKVGG